MRTSPGKTDLRILDHAGNALRLSLVTDIHQTRLDDGEEKTAQRKQREQSEPLPKLCAACKAVLGAREKVCFACGAPVRTLTTVREIAGDLVELGSRRSGQREFPEWERRGFSPSCSDWPKSGNIRPAASHQFKKKFGHWPNDYDRVAMSPSVSTRNWVRSRQIAFAKATRA